MNFPMKIAQIISNFRIRCFKKICFTRYRFCRTQLCQKHPTYGFVEQNFVDQNWSRTHQTFLELHPMFSRGLFDRISGLSNKILSNKSNVSRIASDVFRKWGPRARERPTERTEPWTNQNKSDLPNKKNVESSNKKNYTESDTENNNVKFCM